MGTESSRGFGRARRLKEAQEVQQTKDEADSSPSISKEELPKDAPLKAAKKKRKKVQKKEEEQTTTGTTPKEGSAPQMAASKEEQDYDTPDEETMDFFEELHELARMSAHHVEEKRQEATIAGRETTIIG